MLKTYLDAAIEIAQEAGKILREEMERPPTIAYKGDFDLVTQADRRSEQWIVRRLRELFPDHAVAAEEGTGRDTDSDYRWHVDPLDGTTNFAHGYPCFCVSMALAKGNDLLLGVVYNPIFEEMFWAARGEGSVFKITSGIHCRTFTITGISHCVRTGCVATDRRLWIWRTWRLGGLTGSGN